jgi:flagellar motility protein MotE (MotC chaperone)
MKVRLRLLTVTVFASALVLTVRVGDIWRGLELAAGSVAVAQSKAEQPAPASDSPEAAAAPDGAQARPAGATLIEDEMFSDAEIGMLQDLAARRKELDARERELETRGGLLTAAETRIDEKVAELKALQAKIEGLLKEYETQEKANMSSLVKIYEKMKPKDAARILEKLDMDILLDVVERMREAKSAPILSQMDPVKAKAVTAELAQRRQLPAGAGNGSK